METLDITHLTQICDSDKIHYLNNQLFRSLYYKKTNWDDDTISKWYKLGFPGSEVVNLSKRDFEFMKRTDYWVCEKSGDGVRALVMILSEGVYLCDESFSWFFVEKDMLFLQSCVNPNESQHLTILDCEVTYNYHYEKYCIMIFDVLYIEGKRVMDLTLSKRLLVIRDKIIVPFRNRYPNDKQSSLPFIILGKVYMKVSQINEIFSKIKGYEAPDESRGFRFIYENGIRYNENDGLVFTSEDKCYKPKRCISLKRWKWPIFNTVDFKVVITDVENDPKFTLFYQVNDSLMEYREVVFSQSDKIISDLNGNTEAIIECSFDKSTGNWIYHRIKHDKPTPTNFSSLFQLMEIISENITKEEIVQVFSKKDTDDVIYESPLKKDESPNSVTVGLKRKIDSGYYVNESPETSTQDYEVKKKLRVMYSS